MKTNKREKRNTSRGNTHNAEILRKVRDKNADLSHCASLPAILLVSRRSRRATWKPNVTAMCGPAGLLVDLYETDGRKKNRVDDQRIKNGSERDMRGKDKNQIGWNTNSPRRRRRRSDSRRQCTSKKEKRKRMPGRVKAQNTRKLLFGDEVDKYRPKKKLYGADLGSLLPVSRLGVLVALLGKIKASFSRHIGVTLVRAALPVNLGTLDTATVGFRSANCGNKCTLETALSFWLNG